MVHDLMLRAGLLALQDGGAGAEAEAPRKMLLDYIAEGGEIGLTDEAAAPIVQQSKYGFLLSRRSGVDMRV